MKPLVCAFIAIYFLSCSSKTSEVADADEHLGAESDTLTKSASPTGLCIWNEVSVRETPSEKGKYITSVSLGEEFSVTQDTATEIVSSKKVAYHRVKLSDGTTGWIRRDFIAISAKAGAFTADATIYKRPDLMTATKKTFNYLDYVAIKNTNNDGWSEVIGKRKGDRWFSSGWVRTETLTSLDVDVHFSALYNVVSEIPNDIERQEEIDKLFLGELFTESVFHQQNRDDSEEFSEESEGKDFVETGSSEVDTIAAN